MASESPRRTIVVAASEDEVARCRENLRTDLPDTDVHAPETAFAALRDNPDQLAVMTADRLLALIDGQRDGDRQALLDCVAQGVCVLDRDGNVIWSNRVLRNYPEEVTRAIHERCAGLAREIPPDTGIQGRRRSLCVARQYYFDILAAPLLDGGGAVERVVALAVDTSAVSRLREKIDAIDAAGRELVALEEEIGPRLEVPERLRVLEERVISYCHDLLRFDHFMVMVLDGKTNKLDIVLAGGFSEEAKAVEIYATREGNGISGYVAATGQSYISPDVHADARYLPGYEAARASLTVPLRLNEKVIGVLNVESEEFDAFSEEDRQVAEIFGRYIAVALQMLRLLVAERSETTTQVAADVRSEVAEPLNDIVSEATRLLQGNLSTEEMQRRLQRIIAHVDNVNEAVQEITSPAPIRGLSDSTSAEIPGLRGRRVLIADDEDIIRETIAEVLSKLGALPVMAHDGDQAIAMLNTQEFGLVLSDIKMPNKNGYEVFAAAKVANPDCAVILITGFGYDPEHSIVRASREGLAGVLFKPFKVEQLLELVEKACAPTTT
jgi:CheY-like chemotaxis protein/GAF domain-containing protein